MKIFKKGNDGGFWADAENAYSVVFYASAGLKGFDVYLLKGDAVSQCQVMIDMAKAILKLKGEG